MLFNGKEGVPQRARLLCVACYVLPHYHVSEREGDEGKEVTNFQLSSV